MNYDKDDVSVFRALLEPLYNHDHKQPPVLFAYNYYDIANTLRGYGLRTYSMTVVLSGSHLRGQILNMPFAPGTLGAVVILQKLVYAELFEAIDPVMVGGVFMVEDKNLPYLGQVILQGMGFRSTYSHWHDLRVYRRMSAHEYKAGTGFDVFNKKKVQGPLVIHRAILEAA